MRRSFEPRTGLSCCIDTLCVCPGLLNPARQRSRAPRLKCDLAASLATSRFAPSPCPDKWTYQDVISHIQNCARSPVDRFQPPPGRVGATARSLAEEVGHESPHLIVALVRVRADQPPDRSLGLPAACTGDSKLNRHRRKHRGLMRVAASQWPEHGRSLASFSRRPDRLDETADARGRLMNRHLQVSVDCGQRNAEKERRSSIGAGNQRYSHEQLDVRRRLHKTIGTEN